MTETKQTAPPAATNGAGPAPAPEPCGGDCTDRGDKLMGWFMIGLAAFFAVAAFDRLSGGALTRAFQPKAEDGADVVGS